MKYSLVLVSKFFNPLFLFQRANKQLSILLGYYIAIQALNYHHSYISKQLPPTPGGPILDNLAQTFDGPPTLERSGSEHRRAVTSSRP